MRMNTVSSANNLTVLRPNENGSTVSQSTDGYGDEHGPSETAVDCEPCSSFIRCIVKVKDLEYMNSHWLPGTHDELRNWKGFRHRLVITPPANPQRNKDDDLEFVVILYFLGISNLRAWSTSTERASWVRAAKMRNIYVGSVEDSSDMISQSIDDESDGKGNSAKRKLLSKPTRVELHESMSKAPQALPPPKYKLFLIIWQCVLTLGTVNVLAGSTKDLQAYGVAFSAATFIALCHQMVIIIYCLAPTIMSLSIVEKWIKGPRCPVEQMSPIYSILDQGLQIFAAPMKEKPPEEIMNRLDRLEGKADRLKRVNHELLMLINERSEKIEKAFKESVDDNFNMSDVIPLPGGGDYVSAVDTESGLLRTYDPNDYSGGIYDEDYSEAVDIEKDEVVPLETQCAKLALSRIIDPALIKLELYGTRELGSCLSDDVPFGYKARKQYPNAGLRKKDSMTFHKESNLTASGGMDKVKDKDATGTGGLNQFHFQSRGNDDHLTSPNHSQSFTRQHSEDSFRNRHSSVSLVDLGAPKQLRPNPSSSQSLFELENQTEARRLSVSNSHYKKPLTMVVSHFVKWERTLEFENWLKELFEIMSKFEGFIGQNTTIPTHDGDPYMNAFTFESYECLHEFLTSNERLQLMRNLLPLLEATSIAQISDERVIHNAFSELFISTGGSAPGRPPSLWKITILTVVSLQFIVWSISGTLIPVFQRSRINIALALIATTFTTVLVNIYIGLPLMTLFFGSWLRIPRVPIGEMRPWVAILDSGLKPWHRMAVMFIYFGTILGYGFWRYFTFP